MANHFYRELLKHSSVYAAGQVLSRATSLILLPVYTRYLSASDYGCIAILDLTINVLAILIGAGMAQAVSRFHFLATTDNERHEIWWTALTLIISGGLCLTIPLWFARHAIANLTLGE